MDDAALLRYSRHLLLPQIDIVGQEKLLAARVLIIGLGGLGSPAALYLASSGVGHLILSDHDEVELSNLQRQIIHRQSNIGQNKSISAQNNIGLINDTIKVTAIAHKLDEQELLAQCAKADVVLDCTDRFSARFAINRACVMSKTPLVVGAAIRFDGQLSTFMPAQAASPCYQCLYPAGEDGEELCSKNGILAPVVGVIGVMQALEALKIISGVGQPLVGQLLLFDGLNSQFRMFKLVKDADCEVCNQEKP